MLVTQDNFSQYLQIIEELEAAGVDLETTGFYCWEYSKRDVIAGIGIYHPSVGGFYFSLRHSNTNNINQDQINALMIALQKIQEFRTHNGKFELNFLSMEGFKGNPIIKDSQNALYLLDETKAKGLKISADALLGTDSSQEDKELDRELRQWGYGKGDMWRLPGNVVAKYCIQDCKLAWDLCELLDSKFDSVIKGLWEELNSITSIAHRMERRGVPINLDVLNHQEAEARRMSSKLFLEIQDKTNRRLDPSKPQSIARFLHIANATYESLILVKKKNPIVNDILAFKEWSKIISTYYVPYRTEWICKDGNIRTNFNTIGARSGRWTSKDPNIQTWPRPSKTSEAYSKFKRIIAAEPDMSLVEIDYSQAEIRLAAHYTQDKALIKAIWEGQDIHQFVANEAKIDRQTAKTINFATIYGAGARRLAEQLECSESVAKAFLTSYDKRFPNYKRLSRAAQTRATERGYIEMWNGRRRHYTGPDEQPHTAFNQLIQGGVGQMVNRTVVNLDKVIPDSGLIIQLHDALYFHLPTKDLPGIIPEIKKVMETQPQFSVPMTVDVKVGPSLGEMRKYES